ncbi:hypothetical protein NF700_12785 [Sphingomonadaceae bacterium OTU29MARTA1]|nr:hypothetical protein NF700_12785 [Sphingomonadaceae bacterium OTU29MARTA1]
MTPATSPFGFHIDTEEQAVLPIRRASRVANEMHLSGMGLVNRALPRQFDRSIVLLVIMRVCAPDWTRGGYLHRANGITRFVSVNNIAASLHRPFETVRRHVQALKDAGICVSHSSGLALNPDPSVGLDLLWLYAEYHDLLLKFTEDFGAAGMLPPPVPTRAPGLRLTAIETALDIALMPFERFGTVFADWAQMRVWGCIGALNVRRVMLDPNLDERYSVVSTPNELRRPVPLRSVARTLDMPYATVWRHAHALKAREMLTETSMGWAVLSNQLREDMMESQVRAATLYYMRRLGALTKLGLDPANLDGDYVHGRPTLMPEL